VIDAPGAAFYTQGGADGLFVAGGAYHWSSDEITRYRMAVDAERSGEDLQRLLARLSWMQRDGDTLRSCPRGIAPIIRGWTCCGTARCTCGNRGHRARYSTSGPAWTGFATVGEPPGP
jgi:hypothetical protein